MRLPAVRHTGKYTDHPRSAVPAFEGWKDWREQKAFPGSLGYPAFPVFIKELDCRCLICLNLHRSGIRNDVILACPVCNFCYGINTDTKALNFNHAGFWSGECLAVGAVRTLNLDGKTIFAPVAGILCDL